MQFGLRFDGSTSTLSRGGGPVGGGGGGGVLESFGKVKVKAHHTYPKYIFVLHFSQKPFFSQEIQINDFNLGAESTLRLRSFCFTTLSDWFKENMSHYFLII